MTIQEMIQTEIEHLDEAELRELYQLIRDFVEARRQAQNQTLLLSLSQIQIDGPPDFSANHDLYISGEKDAAPNLHCSRIPVETFAFRRNCFSVIDAIN